MTSIRKTFTVLYCCFILSAAYEACAQFPSFAQSRGKRDKNAATSVKAESMDIDIDNNRVTLIGNVDVNDPEMNIKCGKMILFFVNKNDDGKTEKKIAGREKRNDDKDEDPGSRKIDRIECIDDVEITRMQPESADGKKELQKAYAGKAVYYVQESRITLTQSPMVSSGRNTLRGEFITIDTQTGRISVLKPDTRFIGGLDNAAAVK